MVEHGKVSEPLHKWAFHLHGVQFHEENHLTENGDVWVVVHGRALQRVAQRSWTSESSRKKQF